MPDNQTVKSALAPDFHSRGLYTNRVQQTETVTIIGPDGTSFETEVTFYISWDSIRQILGLAAKRLGL